MITALLLSAALVSSAQHMLADAAPYIDRANTEWTHAIVRGDARVLSAPYDRDGVFIGPDGSAIRGKSAVRGMYARRPSSVKVLKASIHSDGRVVHGTDVYEWGTARMAVQQGKNISNRSGRYLTVWHRHGSAWVISRNLAF